MIFKRIVYLIAIFSFISPYIFSQNLISNGSFESFEEDSSSKRKSSLIAYPAPTDWVFLNTVDVYSSYSQTYGRGMAKKTYPQDGNIYIGLLECVRGHGDYREFAIGLIKRPLIKGHRYLVSFYLQYSYSSFGMPDKFHVVFLRGKNDFPNNIRDGFPDTLQVLSIPMYRKYMEDWSLVTDTIVATGDEAEMLLCNFVLNDADIKFLDANKDTVTDTKKAKKGKKVYPNPPAPYCYIFLDNVSLTALDSDLVVEQPIVQQKGSVVRLNNIRFKFNDTTFASQYNDTLRFLTDTIKHTSLNVRLTGFTDSIGNYQYNLMLSQKRANAIRNILLKSGIPPERISIDYKSYFNPVSSNQTEHERSMNRRVEIVLLRE